MSVAIPLLPSLIHFSLHSRARTRTHTHTHYKQLIPYPPGHVFRLIFYFVCAFMSHISFFKPSVLVSVKHIIMLLSLFTSSSPLFCHLFWIPQSFYFHSPPPRRLAGFSLKFKSDWNINIRSINSKVSFMISIVNNGKVKQAQRGGHEKDRDSFESL